MPTKPQIVNLTGSSVDILNAIRNNASQNYQDYIPVANPDAASIRSIGAIIMDYPVLQNEFLNALVNRIGRVIITSKMYQNPWSVLKKGVLEFGETIEEVFVNIAKPFQFDPAVAENEVFKRNAPDVRAAFHILNYKKFYKTTIENEQLRQAFLSWDGITNLIARIVDAMYSGANYDEFQVMKYLIAKAILDGRMNPTVISQPIIQANMKEIAATIKGVSNSFEFMSTKNNVAGVATFTNKEDQYLILNAKFDAVMDVEVLASAFNLSKAEFMGRRITVDSFGSLDMQRLSELFDGNPDYVPLTNEQLQSLDDIPGVLIDKDWFMIFDNMYKFTEIYNAQGLYWNYFYHVWKTFSYSPFANATVFIKDEPAVTDVSVSPTAATLSVGASLQLNAIVTTTAFASQAVKWGVSNAGSPYLTVDNFGLVKCIAAPAATTNYEVTATSVFDNTTKAICTITVQV